MVVSRQFRTFDSGSRCPTLAHPVAAPLICCSFSRSMFKYLLKYLLVDQVVAAMCCRRAAAR